MLGKILSKESCANCRVCCIFDREDVWEMPLVSKELKAYITNRSDADVKLTPVGGEYRFDVEFKDGEELVSCPMLTDTGCSLGDNKPFDCRIWPFRIMRIKDNLCGITVSPVCECVSALSVAQLSDFLINHKHENGKALYEIIAGYAVIHTDIIKPYIDDYPILKLVRL